MLIKRNLILLLIFSILVCLSVCIYCSETKPKYTDKEVCYNLYIHKKNKKYKVLKKIFTKKECKEIINEGINYAENNKWKNDRHEHYPTVDNQVDEEWDIWSLINNKVKNKIYPKIEKLFNIEKGKLNITEIFLVKYDENGQRELKFHEDGSEFSFIIALNDDFTGGGTTFKHKSKIIKPKIGDCLIFSGQNTHKGNYINSGTRYILTGFISYIKDDFCENMINNLEQGNM